MTALSSWENVSEDDGEFGGMDRCSRQSPDRIGALAHWVANAVLARVADRYASLGTLHSANARSVHVFCPAGLPRSVGFFRLCCDGGP